MAVALQNKDWFVKATLTLKGLLKAEPVPCWFDYLHQTDK